MKPVTLFMRCTCTIWAMQIGENHGWCSDCGEKPSRYSEPPTCGKTHPIHGGPGHWSCLDPLDQYHGRVF